MKSIRRNIFYCIYNDRNIVKALALAVFVKNMVKSSSIPNFTIDKLHKLTGLHATTIKKRLKTLDNLGLISRTGNNEEHLVFNSISSHHKFRNVDISKAIFDSVKDVEKSLLTFVVVEIQKRKNFVKQLLNLKETAKNYAEAKAANKKCRAFGLYGEYQEYGISYRKIAKEMCVSVAKAVSIVKYAVENQFLNKTHNQKQVFCLGVASIAKYELNIGGTFYTKDNIYKIYANTYTLGSRLN